MLSHGQSQVERGFGINAETLSQNMKEKNIVSQILIYDQMLASKAAPLTIVINWKKKAMCINFQLTIQASTGRKGKKSCRCRKGKGRFCSNGK